MTCGGSPGRRAGFTLIELLVVAAVGGLLVLGIYGTLRTQQAAFTVQAAQVQRQQSLRSGLDVLVGELRSISAAGGDILGMDDDSISVRVMRRLGIVCNVTYGSPPIVFSFRGGAPIRTGDSVFVFADGNVNLASDDVWISAKAGVVDTLATCNGQPAQRIPLPGAASAMAADTVRDGALLRTFEWRSFGIGKWGGDTYLGQWRPGEPFVPLVGPLDGRGSPPLRLEYFDSSGNVTAIPTEVQRIEVVVRTTSPFPAAPGGMMEDSLRAIVYARN